MVLAFNFEKKIEKIRMKKEKQTKKTKQSKAKQNQKANSVKKPHLILSFLAYLLKLYTPGSIIVLFFLQQYLVRLFPLKEVRLKFLIFDTCFLPYDINSAKTRRRMKFSRQNDVGSRARTT